MNLTIQNLTKEYRNGVKALDHLDLEIGKGMFGLLGPNGAGKSTLMRTIATLQMPDTGSITFEGVDVLKDPIVLRKKLGYLPQDFGVYPKESAVSLLNYLAILKGISKKRDRQKIINYVLEITNLTDVKKKIVSGYSGGMKQRFGIAQLLLNDPKLIIVDEPTAGLDPAERNRFLNILREIGTKSTVIFSTHIVDDIKELCTDMAIMNEGRVLAHDAPVNATSKLMGKLWIKDISQRELEDIKLNYTVLSSNFNQDDSIRVRVFSEELPGEGFSFTEPNLEDVYFKILRG